MTRPNTDYSLQLRHWDCVSLMGTLNNDYSSIHSFDDLLLKGYYHILLWTISYFILYVFFNLDLLCCCVNKYLTINLSVVIFQYKDIWNFESKKWNRKLLILSNKKIINQQKHQQLTDCSTHSFILLYSGDETRL